MYEFNPPLYFVLMNLWVHQFGDRPISLAIPSMVLGVLLIPAVYLFARELYRREDIALWAAFFAAVSPLAVLYSHFARSYSLLALLMALAMYAFLRSIRKSSPANLIMLWLSLVLLFYTHYVALYLFGMLLLSALIYSRLPNRSAGFRLVPLTLCLLLAAFGFAFWLPFLMEHRTADLYWVDRQPLANFPFVLINNLAASFPSPWLATAIGLCAALPVVLVLFIRKLIKMRNNARTSGSDAGYGAILLQWTVENKASLFLLANTLLPAATIGYTAPLIIGYSRYMVAFSVFAWTLWAAVLARLIDAAQSRIISRTGLSEQQNDESADAVRARLVRAKIVLLALLVLPLILVDYRESQWLADGDRSGLRRFARDWKLGKFNDCALMMVPDYDSYMLIYYLSREQNGELPSLYYTYPRANTLVPGQHQGCAEAFQDEGNRDRALEWVEQLKGRGCTELVVISDKDALDSKLMPARTRAHQLLDELAKRFHRLDPSEDYPSKGNSFEVYRFDLRP